MTLPAPFERRKRIFFPRLDAFLKKVLKFISIVYRRRRNGNCAAKPSETFEKNYSREIKGNLSFSTTDLSVFVFALEFHQDGIFSIEGRDLLCFTHYPVAEDLGKWIRILKMKFTTCKSRKRKFYLQFIWQIN